MITTVIDEVVYGWILLVVKEVNQDLLTAHRKYAAVLKSVSDGTVWGTVCDRS